MTPRELAGEASQRAQKRLSRAISRAVDDPQSTFVTDADLLRALGRKSLADVLSRIRSNQTSVLLPGLADLESTAAVVKQLFPDSIQSSMSEASAIIDHKIRLFDRIFDLGPKIDWHRDPSTNIRWPTDHFTKVPLVLGDGSDVRLVWELNRLQHLVALGVAYQLTGDERYPEEVLRQLVDWCEENPPRFGVNWTVAMEAGIRAVNIIAALQLCRTSRILTDQAIELVLKILIAHGRYIRANLEFSHRTNSNHYLSNLIGLFAIGKTLPEFREARAWRDYSAVRLVREMKQQVLKDGVDYAGSIAYHRFVLEIFSMFYSLCGDGEFDPGPDLRSRLEAMFEFVGAYLKPDGSAPSLGDSDDGRLLRFKTRPALDHSYLLSIGAILFENANLKDSALIDEEAIWWLGREGVEAFGRLKAVRSQGSQAFEQAQIFVQRHENLYSIIDCGDHGARGRGSHAHSDAISFELFAFDRTFIIDPGTYAYTASEKDRNLFRSTAYHNTVRIDAEEISQVNPGELFAFASNVRPKINAWNISSERDEVDAEHYAYKRLAEPLVHRRIISFEKRDAAWIVKDIFTGRGKHQFEFFFNLDADLEVEILEDNRATIRDEKTALTISPKSDHSLHVSIESRWISRAYGTRLKSSAIIYRLAAEIPLQVSFEIAVSKLE